MKRCKLFVVVLFLFALIGGCSPRKYRVDLTHTARLGKQGAPIEVVVFSDFECLFCKRAAAELKRIHRNKPNRVKIYYKYFPLSRHKNAFNAARAAEAAALQGKFWEMHDLLFAHAKELKNELYEELAKKIGLDVARFKKDMWSKEVKERVSADKTEGLNLGVASTPYFIVNKMPFRYSYADLNQRISGMDGYR
jgi:protein-disulfide isomerase